MLDAGYRKRIAADMPRWLDAGWVTTDGAVAILASASGGRRTTFGLSTILGTLGALLLGLAVVAFVSSQWEFSPRVARFGMIVAGLLIAYAAAFQFERRGLRIFAEAGVLAGGVIFAAGIALVGQTYHLSGDFSGAVLLFEAGVLAAAVVTGSPTLTVLGLVGSGYWVWLATWGNGIAPHWGSAAAIGISVVVATTQNSHYGRILAIVAVIFWSWLTIGGLADAAHWTAAGGMMVFCTAALAIWALGAALASLPERRIAALGDAVLWPGLFAILIPFGMLQFWGNASVGEHLPQTLAFGLESRGDRRRRCGLCASPSDVARCHRGGRLRTWRDRLRTVPPRGRTCRTAHQRGTDDRGYAVGGDTGAIGTSSHRQNDRPGGVWS
jgi:uncharacterized membrane protein